LYDGYKFSVPFLSRFMQTTKCHLLLSFMGNSVYLLGLCVTAGIY